MYINQAACDLANVGFWQNRLFYSYTLTLKPTALHEQNFVETVFSLVYVTRWYKLEETVESG